MFESDRFIEDCCRCLGEQNPHAAVREAVGRAVSEPGGKLKDTLPLGEAVIHAVNDPLDRITAAIHVDGGDFFAVPRSEWDPQTLQERPFDLERAKQVFAEANKRLVFPDTEAI